MVHGQELPVCDCPERKLKFRLTVSNPIFKQDKFVKSIKVVEENNKFSCPVCGFKTNRKDCILSHIKNYFECDHCDKIFYRDLEEHYKHFLDQNNHSQCKDCRVTYWKNEKITHKCNALKCLFCMTKFKDRSSYYKHMRRTHASFRIPELSCDRCQQYFSSHTKFGTHICLNNQKRCPYCAEFFDEGFTYKTHIHLKHMVTPDCDTIIQEETENK